MYYSFHQMHRMMHKFFYLTQEVGEQDDNFHPRPKGGEVHRMMSSQTGEGKPQGAELVPPAERTKSHMGRPKQ